ncbi:MAG: tripartite tricarboxylate transporter substrate binding protein [Burkholderiales bacterium]|nr:tripartite tricarboxylate transporter substrate binding protein [Burkholderiales bacterium]
MTAADSMLSDSMASAPHDPGDRDSGRRTQPPRPARRRLLASLAGAAALAAMPRAHAQAWPTRPIRIVHGYDSGSNPDTVARAIGPAMSERLGQPIVIEPRPGAGGRIATAYAATQEADAHTLMMLTAGDCVLAATDPGLPYDLARDFAFIGTVVQFPFVIMVRPASPLRSIADAIDAAKKSPGKLSFATPGVRTTQHLAGELIKATAGIDMLHVPFKGTSFQDLIGGRVDLLFAAPSISTPQVKAGAVRAIAVTGKTRLDALPGVATVAETLPGFDVSSWLGLAAPAKSPPAALARLSTELRAVLGQETVRARLTAIGSDPVGGSQDELRERVATDIRKWRELAKTAKLDG